MRFRCPHCGSLAKVRSSREITPLTREAYLQCRNLDCCHAWKVFFSAVETVHKSRRPRADVFIPLARKDKPPPKEKDGKE